MKNMNLVRTLDLESENLASGQMILFDPVSMFVAFLGQWNKSL